MKQENLFSHLTAKERDFLSFPSRYLMNQNLLTGDVLDFGCGLGKDVAVLSEKGYAVSGFDPHYLPEVPSRKYDTIICIYVLNVLLPEEQASVLMEISHLLKPAGKAYFAVRRDILSEGYRMHKVHRRQTYQCNVILPYKSIFRNESCEIYEYTPWNQHTGSVSNSCPFCSLNASREIILESATAFSVWDKYPVSAGHALIIPKRHMESYFDISFKEQAACIFMANKVKNEINNKYNPDGYNLGINIGKAAGQTVPHVHLHLIPRYHDDVANPEGGIRGVIPLKKDY